ncbi:DEAD/DEAH box helicase, partial [Pseudoxanthomonas sp. SGD-10]
KEILEKLQVERNIHGRFKNLVVAATGTGKTVISAFDFKAFRQLHPQATFLFIAHRKEILTQARHTFRNILRDGNFAELWVDGNEIKDKKHLFASVQTLNNNLEALQVSPSYYDYIIVDEGHHAAANTYQKFLSYFKPQILLGLTATPERMDGESILPYFDHHIAAEIRLPEALNHKLLTPFQYFAISDNTDLSNVRWEKGRYVSSDLTKLYTANDIRVRDIIHNFQQYTKDLNDVIAIGFCVSKEHALFMSNKFIEAGLKANALTSDTASETRKQVLTQLRTKEINYLFVVDILNEGVDIPEIDTLLFLRPTESLTIFLQQLGRGLRLCDGKDALTVLDFVGNAN